MTTTRTSSAQATSALCTANRRICVGCCIKPSDGDKSLVERDLATSTIAEKELADPKRFGSHSKLYVLPSGLCPNLVKRGTTVCCASHPAVNKGIDYRPPYPQCYKEFLCPTAQLFNKWTQGQRDKFQAFLANQAASSAWYEYGINMDDGTWLKRFRERNE